MKKALFICILLLVCFSFSSPNYFRYKLNQPDKLINLSDELHEISGIAKIDSNTFVCIQDEKGTVFLYNFEEERIQKRYSFNIDGDYEGIALVNKSLFILRSDGMLIEMPDYKESNTINQYPTGIAANNNEGLCFDKENNRLLIACKSKLSKGIENKDERVIYGFDLTSHSLSKDPVCSINITDIIKYAAEHNLKLPNHPVKNKKAGKDNKVKNSRIKFMPSEIAIHPISKNFYILSAMDKILLEYDPRQSQIVYLEFLDDNLFIKPEGITFFENGDMFISNEGKDKKPNLLMYKMK